MKWGVRKKEESGGGGSELPAKKLPPRHTKYEASALAKGRSPEEAKKIADRKVIRDRVILGTVAVAAVGAGAYIARDIYVKDFKAVDIAKGATLNNVNVFGDKVDMDRRMYVTTNSKDANKYKSLYARQLLAKHQGESVYQATLRAKESIKAPSNREAVKMYKEFRANHPQGALLPKDYRMFNRSLVGMGNAGNHGVDAQWYSTLRKKGYNALLDTNDQHISGYNTRQPLILLNAGKTTVNEASRKLSGAAMDEGRAAAERSVYAHSFMKQNLPLLTMGAAGIAGLNTLNNKSANKQIAKYRREHPNTMLSDAQIYNNLLGR